MVEEILFSSTSLPTLQETDPGISLSCLFCSALYMYPHLPPSSDNEYAESRDTGAASSLRNLKELGFDGEVSE